MSERREIYCAGCEKEVSAHLTDGAEMYPHRPDLKRLPFWVCRTCGAFVGCHHKTANRTNPLGILATPELKRARSHIHRVLDPIWKSKRMKRSDVYQRMGELLGYDYHTGEVRSIEQARTVYRAAATLAREAP